MFIMSFCIMLQNFKILVIYDSNSKFLPTKLYLRYPVVHIIIRQWKRFTHKILHHVNCKIITSQALAVGTNFKTLTMIAMLTRICSKQARFATNMPT